MTILFIILTCISITITVIMMYAKINKIMLDELKLIKYSFHLACATIAKISDEKTQKDVEEVIKGKANELIKLRIKEKDMK